jgi:hypothetical protein
MWSLLHFTGMVDHLLLVLFMPTTQKNCHTRYCEAYTYANVNFIKSEPVFTYSVNINIRIEMMYNWFLSGEKLTGSKVEKRTGRRRSQKQPLLPVVSQPGQCLS